MYQSWQETRRGAFLQFNARHIQTGNLPAVKARHIQANDVAWQDRLSVCRQIDLNRDKLEQTE